MNLGEEKFKQSRRLKSKIWQQGLREVSANPYDYKNQNLFIEEAKLLLDEAYKLYDFYQLKFRLDDESLEKCIWMLQLDAIDTLRDSVYLMEKKKHRIVGKMFRDITESLDIAHLIKKQPEKYLSKFYKGKNIRHSDFRKSILNKSDRDMVRGIYGEMSGWTHHEYKCLLHSYSIGGKDTLVYDSHNPRVLVLPKTISQYLWILSILIKHCFVEMETSGLFKKDKLKDFRIDELL